MALLNVGGFYDGIVAFMSQLARDGFLKPAHEECLLVDERVESLLEKMRHFHPPQLGKWMERMKAEER